MGIGRYAFFVCVLVVICFKPTGENLENQYKVFTSNCGEWKSEKLWIGRVCFLCVFDIVRWIERYFPIVTLYCVETGKIQEKSVEITISVEKIRIFVGLWCGVYMEPGPIHRIEEGERSWCQLLFQTFLYEFVCGCNTLGTNSRNFHGKFYGNSHVIIWFQCRKLKAGERKETAK